MDSINAVNDSPRYAIYFVPCSETQLYRFGSAVLGYDCYTGADVEHPGLAGLPEDWPQLTTAPRTYGFHATLKAPFYLAPRSTEPALLRSFEEFAEHGREIPAIEPVVHSVGRFIAVVPRRRSAALDRLAADCITEFDRFRAPLSPEQRARRLDAELSDGERANLDRWGYPYVLDHFRFHMTLTGPLRDHRRAEIRNLLSELLTRSGSMETLRIDRLALVRQDGGLARFRVLCHLNLKVRDRPGDGTRAAYNG